MPRFHGVVGTVPQPADVYRMAVDTGLVCAHLGVTNPEDDYETARKKLNDLICWSVQVDRDLGQTVNDDVMDALIEALEAVEHEHTLRSRMQDSVIRRNGKTFGIAVHSDKYALEWQEYSKELAALIAKRDEALANYRAAMESK